MKKSVLFGIVGLAAAVATSYGQGYLALDNYNGGPLFTYGAGVPANGVSGALGSGGLNSAWTVGLYWTAGAQSIVDPAGTGLPNAALALGTGTGSTVGVAGSEVGGALGQFTSIPTFNTGSSLNTQVTLEIVAYPTSAGSYAAAAYRWHSSPFVLATSTATAGTPAYTGPAMTDATFAVAQVAAVPEPTTLALAGLGGLASLVALRRKQS